LIGTSGGFGAIFPGKTLKYALIDSVFSAYFKCIIDFDSTEFKSIFLTKITSEKNQKVSTSVALSSRFQNQSRLHVMFFVFAGDIEKRMNISKQNEKKIIEFLLLSNTLNIRAGIFTRDVGTFYV
jgi:hypothetical protein